MSGRAEVSIKIDAPPEAVYALISDVTRMGEWSPENTGGRWIGGASAAKPGAQFVGTNRSGARRWSTRCTIVSAERGREISWESKMFGRPIALWRYELRPTDSNGTEVTETAEDRRGTIFRVVGDVTLGGGDRVEHNRKTMAVTLERLKMTAESTV